MKNEYFAEDKGLKIGVLPVNLNGAGQTGARLNLREFHRVAIVIQYGDSTSAAVGVTLQQHDAASAGNSKNLSVANPYYHKVAAETSFTKVEPSSEAAVYDLASLFADDEGIVVFEVTEDQLDAENDFAFLSVDLASAGATDKLVSVLYVGESALGPAYELSL